MKVLAAKSITTNDITSQDLCHIYRWFSAKKSITTNDITPQELCHIYRWSHVFRILTHRDIAMIMRQGQAYDYLSSVKQP